MAIVIKTVSDSKAAQDDLAKLRQSVDGIKTSADNVSKSISNFTKAIGVGVAAFAGFKVFTTYSDELTNLESKLRLVTKSQEEMNIAFREIQRIAVSTRSDLSTVSSLYTRIAMSAGRFGASQRDIVKFSESVTKAMAVSGASVQESQAALQQLGQALASGRLQGDELRSILENAPSLALAIADGLGVSIGKLRAMGEAGEVTSVKVFKAILKQQDQINSNFGKMGVTYGGAFVNLGNALRVLFSKVKSEVFGSTSSLAEGINSFAVAIVDFANNFKLNMQLARASVLIFVLDAVNLFDEFYTKLEEVGIKVAEIANDLYVAWKPAIKSAIADLALWAQAATATAIVIYNSLYNSFKGTEFGSRLISGVEASFKIIAAKLISIFDNIKSRLPTIDVRAIFPGLDAALAYLGNWATKAERWFFWLYDKVIGNSWIPDLVIGVVDWTKKLLGSPLKYVADFAGKSSSIFSNIKFASAFSAGIAAISKMRSAIVPLLVTLTAVAGILTAIGFLKNKSIDFSIKKPDLSLGGSSSKVENLLDKAVKWLKSTFDLTKKSFNESLVGRTLKQLLGMKDTTPGSVYGVPIDTNAKVGRGPFRNQEDRPVGHDFINALAPGWQIPVIAAFTGIFALAIMKAFDAGTTRTVLLSVLTSAAGIAIAQTVSDKQITKTFSGAAFTTLDILEKGISALFNGNIIKDPLGFLSLLAKTALLFSKGRELLLGAATSIAKAPTSFVQTLFTAGEAKFSTAKAEKVTKEISQLPAKLNQAFSTSNKLYQDSVRQLSRLTDATGNVIGMQKALSATRAGDTKAFGGGDTQVKLAEAVRAFNQQQKAQTDLSNVKATRADLVSQRDILKKQGEELGKQVADAKAAFTQGIKNFGAGVGGVLGGVAGFQVGVEIARGMSDSPGWARVGVIIGTAMGAQAIGSAIGLAISTILLGTAARIGGLIATGFMLMNPLMRGITVVAAVFVAGYALFRNLPDEWKKALGFQTAKEAQSTTVAVVVTDAVNKLATNQEQVQANLKQLAEDLRANGVNRTFGPGVNATLMGSNLDPMQRQAVQFYASQPSPQEREENLRINRELIEKSKNLNETFGKLVEWIIGQREPTKKASGGWIRGPGSATSDSIPAMLSNGEFVINARDAAKNWSILNAINNGKDISKFASGGSVGVQHYQSAGPVAAYGKPLGVVVTNAKEITAGADKSLIDLFSSAFKDSYKSVSEVLTKALGNIDPLKTLGVPSGGKPAGGTATDDRGQLTKQLDLTKSLDDSAKLLEKGLTGAGYKNISVEGLKGLTAATTANIAEALDKINELQEKSSKRPAGSFLRKQAEEAINDLNTQIVESLRTSRTSFNAPSNFKEEPKEKKPSEITLGDQLSILNKAFPLIDLSVDEFRGLTDKLREGVFSKALEVERASENMDKEIIGFLERGETIPQTVYAKRKEIEAKRIEYQKLVANQLEDVRTPFASLKATFSNLGLNLTEDVYNALDEGQVTLLNDLRAGAEAAQRALKLPKSVLSSDLRLAAQEKFATNINQINEIIADAAKLGLDRKGQMKFELAKFNISLDDFTYNMLSDLERTTINAYLSALKTARDKLKDQDLPEADRQAAQNTINSNVENVNKLLATRAPGYKSPGKMAGEAFASELNESFTNATIAAFKGQSNDNQGVLETFMRSIVDTFTSTVISTFIKGMTESFMGENSPLMQGIKSIGSSIFSVGGKTAAGIGSFTSPANDTGAVKPEGSDGIISSILTLGGLLSAPLFGIAASTTANSVASTLGVTVAEAQLIYLGTLGITIPAAIATSTATIVAAIGAAASTIAVSNAIPFATGGRVVGAGTGTSDSIPAMLSNGEYVINAKATQAALPLLEAINSGRFNKYANGGIATTGMLNTPALSLPSAPVKAQTDSSQIFNINITGDVSRQTRAEVAQMLPQIAVGVNSYNREKAIRR